MRLGWFVLCTLQMKTINSCSMSHNWVNKTVVQWKEKLWQWAICSCLKRESSEHKGTETWKWQGTYLYTCIWPKEMTSKESKTHSTHAQSQAGTRRGHLVQSLKGPRFIISELQWAVLIMWMQSLKSPCGWKGGFCGSGYDSQLLRILFSLPFRHLDKFEHWWPQQSTDPNKSSPSFYPVAELTFRQKLRAPSFEGLQKQWIRKLKKIWNISHTRVPKGLQHGSSASTFLYNKLGPKTPIFSRYLSLYNKHLSGEGNRTHNLNISIHWKRSTCVDQQGRPRSLVVQSFMEQDKQSTSTSGSQWSSNPQTQKPKRKSTTIP